VVPSASRSSRSNTPLRAGISGTHAQPFVEPIPVDHADEAPLDGDVDLLAGGRDHPSAGGPRDQLLIGHGVISDEPRRDRAAAGLDPTRAIEQRHPAPAARQLMGCGRSGRTAADHHRIEDLFGLHPVHPRPALATR